MNFVPESTKVVPAGWQDRREPAVTCATSTDCVLRPTLPLPLCARPTRFFGGLTARRDVASDDGYALIAQIRALAPEQGGNTSAVSFTVYARSEDRFKVILAGFQMHMAKPVEAAELLALVASLAGRVAGC